MKVGVALWFILTSVPNTARADDEAGDGSRPWAFELHQTGLFLLPPREDVSIVPMLSNFPSLYFGYFLSEEWRITLGLDWLHGVYSDERHYVMFMVRPEIQYHFARGDAFSGYALLGVGVSFDSEHTHAGGLDNIETYTVPRAHLGAGVRWFSGPLSVGVEARVAAMLRIGTSERSSFIVAPQLDLYGGVRF